MLGLLPPEQQTHLDTFMHGRGLIDLLADFPGVIGDAAELTAMLPKLPPRLYSISSSPRAHRDEVHTTVAVVRYRAHDRQRGGVCSTLFADRMALGETAPVYIQVNKKFRLPADSTAPVIMIGSGTGIAPFRSFLHDRRATGAKGPTLLPVLNWTALALAVLGTIASSFIYLIKARPAWNTVHTPLDFLVTGLLGGSVLFRLVGGLLTSAPQFLAYAGVAVQLSAAAWVVNFLVRVIRMKFAPTFELRAIAKLLTGPLRKELDVAAMTVLASVVFSASGMVPLACGVLLFGAPVLRYLFFVSVVPLSMALTFLNQESAH